MRDFMFLEDMTNEEQSLFKKSMRKLLDCTFLVQAKDEKYYSFVARQSNRQNIAEYLHWIGYDLEVIDEQGVAMLKNYEIDEEENGLKRSNLLNFDGSQVPVLWALWSIYLSKNAYQETVYTTFEELMNRLKYYDISADLKQSNFKDTMNLLKRYSLIDFPKKAFEDQDLIHLYSSLQFGMDFPQFKVVLKEYFPNIDFGIDDSLEKKVVQ